MSEKTCRICKETKPLDREHFYYRTASADGHQSMCIECKKQANKDYVKTPEGRAIKCAAVLKYFKTEHGRKKHKVIVERYHEKLKQLGVKRLYELKEPNEDAGVSAES